MSTVRAYHFVAEKFALDNLRHQRLKIARINELNDPFDLWSISQPNRDLRRALRNTKDNLAKRFGLVCFSLSWQNPLLWSHYADKHRGIALGFDINRDKIKEVTYVAKRPVLRAVNGEIANHMLFTKYEGWKYENEARVFTELKESDPDSNLYFAPFSDDLVLREVITGPLSTAKKSELRKALQKPAGVTFIKSRLAFNSFLIVRDKRGLS